MNLLSEFNKTRKFIEPEKYEELVELQRSKTRIGFCLLGWSVDDRIDELQTLEDELGFVYLAEKAWLLDFKETGEYPLYSLWLENTIWKDLESSSHIVELVEDKRYWPEKVFKVVIGTQKYALDFKDKIPSDYIFPESLELNITCNHNSVSQPHLIMAYEIIHDLEYILHSISKNYSSDTLIESIDVVSKDDPRAWLINQGDGSFDWDMPVRGRK
ncbi:TPA: hypothetical protein ACMD2S_004368 [Vibrio parahaemolyticus]